MENLCILGSTGSIGTQALDVARNLNMRVTSLACMQNIDILQRQIEEFHPLFVAVLDFSKGEELRLRISGMGVTVLTGKNSVRDLIELDTKATIVLNAIVGMAGLVPTLTAIKTKKTLALANKESLVCAGELVKRECKKNDVALIPVDSEHSAIFQCLNATSDKRELKSIILTASGGPFFGKTKDELKNVTLKDALSHPTWQMGAKITVDSATMVNKGLEVIEAAFLFDVSPDDINVVVHPQSVLHSAVEFLDSTVIAQMALPDMRVPIQYALTYPKRVKSPVGHLDLTKYGSLEFFDVDYDTFPLVRTAKKVLKMGGLYPAVFNCANEEANLLFREGKIGFLDITSCIRKTIDAVSNLGSGGYDLNDVLEIDKWAREYVLGIAKGI